MILRNVFVPEPLGVAAVVVGSGQTGHGRQTRWERCDELTVLVESAGREVQPAHETHNIFIL